MKQHPIPHNVLDVEFKLFTKFTLKEFGYLAAGVLSGSLFLLLNAQVGLPGLIAWPAFLILSGIGAFFALVPINDQNADEFVKNYFKAINKPTQRTWLNEKMQENRTKPIINADLQDKKKIIGGHPSDKSNTFVEKPGDDIFDAGQQEEKNSSSKTNNQMNKETLEKPSKSNSSNMLVIGPQNISDYQINIQSIDRLPGNINLWVTDVNNRGLANIPVYLKDKDGKVIFANKTGPNGYFLANQMFQPNVYYIEFKQDTYNIPKIQLILEGKEGKSPIKITAQMK
jgi:hypothetical protein